MKKIFSFLIFGILLLAIFVLSRQPAGFRRELDKRDAELRGHRDSLNALIETTRARDARMQERVDSLTRGLKVALNEVQTKTIQYERLKRSIPKRLPDSTLNSRLSAYR